MAERVRDFSGFRHTSNASIEVFYGAGLGGIASTQGFSGTLYAVPYVSPGGTLAKAGVFIANVAAGEFVRGAIYQSATVPNIYPSTLVADLGSFSAASFGLAAGSCGLTLANDTLYWLVAWTSGAGAFDVRRGTPRHGLFGMQADFGGVAGAVSVPYTGDLLGAGFPATFPHSGRSTTPTQAIPTIFLAYSAMNATT